MACSILFLKYESYNSYADVFISSRCVLVWAFGRRDVRDKNERRTDERRFSFHIWANMVKLGDYLIVQTFTMVLIFPQNAIV